MCGIIGFVGNEPAAPILLDGLERMEYRGYDSRRRDSRCARPRGGFRSYPT